MADESRGYSLENEDSFFLTHGIFYLHYNLIITGISTFLYSTGCYKVASTK
jgi:hypothetical protein